MAGTLLLFEDDAKHAQTLVGMLAVNSTYPREVAERLGNIICAILDGDTLQQAEEKYPL